MPTRFVREGIITSVPVNSLSDSAEKFYRRLLNIADDYGRFWANAEILRFNIYQLQLDRNSEEDIKKYLHECCNTKPLPLIVIYGMGQFLQITKFGQQRRGLSKYPPPTPEDISPEILRECEAVDKQLISNENLIHNSFNGSELDRRNYHKDARSVLKFLNVQSGRGFRESESTLCFISARLKEDGVTTDGVMLMIERQCRRWRGTEMAEYLRPETLFNKTKFDSYYATKDLPVTKREAPLTAQIKAIENQIATHPANKESVRYERGCTEAQRTHLRELRKRLHAVNARIAEGEA